MLNLLILERKISIFCCPVIYHILVNVFFGMSFGMMLTIHSFYLFKTSKTTVLKRCKKCFLHYIFCYFIRILKICPLSLHFENADLDPDPTLVRHGSDIPKFGILWDCYVGGVHLVITFLLPVPGCPTGRHYTFILCLILKYFTFILECFHQIGK